DQALRAAVETLGARMVIGVGAFAEDRAVSALENTGIKTGRILHPSPASPLANKGWAETASQQLHAMGALAKG
ncbi:hypothetical protein PSY31_23990, partial [Shigella flexneri]|nr:hypothetical protein [Shigella flexneri]